jgi:predicted N-acetyltransferase YhbS
MKSVIRLAAEREIAEIAAVAVAAYREYQSEVPAPLFADYIADLSRVADYWQEAEVLVAEVGGRITGSVMFYADASTEGLGLPREWSGFRKLAVEPAMRGRGLGRELTQACIDAARRRNAPTLGIHTASFMRAACRLYERMGFRRCPELDIDTSDMGLGDGADGVKVIAYRLDLEA